MNPTTKSKLLFLVQYMMENTDDQHKLTAEELIAIYEDNGFKANRNTIRDDIAVFRI